MKVEAKNREERQKVAEMFQEDAGILFFFSFLVHACGGSFRSYSRVANSTTLSAPPVMRASTLRAS